jgi:hypothetical protein
MNAGLTPSFLSSAAILERGPTGSQLVRCWHRQVKETQRCRLHQSTGEEEEGGRHCRRRGRYCGDEHPSGTVSKVLLCLPYALFDSLADKLPFFLCSGRPPTQKLRVNAKAAAGRGQPPRPSPAAAPVTPAANAPVVFFPGTYKGAAGAKETAAQTAAGKKPVYRSSIPPSTKKAAEASASDAAQFKALKLEAAEKLTPNPATDYSETLAKLLAMREGTNKYHAHMQLLSTQVQNDLEVILSRSPRALGG